MAKLQQQITGSSRIGDQVIDPLSNNWQTAINDALQKAEAAKIISPTKEAAQQFVEVDFEQTVGE